MYRVKSKSTCSYFGKYVSKAAAECDAESANMQQKGGNEDWRVDQLTDEDIDRSTFDIEKLLQDAMKLAKRRQMNYAATAIQNAIDSLDAVEP